mmetsp:Transcript_4943/g.9965  ORF Transcript_4943/g.9965 Transcript_4943/m.9965 type:complete len:463 (+) Transcript_4943:100-1488(+)
MIYDVVVVGAGVAGASMATVLGRRGMSVLCVERDLREPDRIVGELLQPGGYRRLCELGLGDAVDGIDAQEVVGYGMFLDGSSFKIGYSEDGAETGRAFHNGRFVRRLRELAMAEPTVRLVEGNVVSFIRDGDGVNEEDSVRGVMYVNPDGERVEAYGRITIACDGCFSRLRAAVNPSQEFKVTSQFAGLILEQCRLPYSRHGHVVLSGASPVLFYQISSTEVRCLVDIPPNCVTGSMTTKDYLRENVSPALPDVLRKPFLVALDTGNIRTMPNRVMSAQPASSRGVILLGDSFNMRHPLTGGGMTVALNDVLLLRDQIADGLDLEDYDAVEKALLHCFSQRKNLSGTINILANALHGVFSSSGDACSNELRRACFEYLAKGGRRSHDPITMLGGLQPSPLLLTIHFFLVALYGCGRVLCPFPTPKRMKLSWSLFRKAYNLIKPLIDSEQVTFLRFIPISRIY